MFGLRCPAFGVRTPLLHYSITPLLPTPARLERHRAAVAGDRGPLAGEELEQLLGADAMLRRNRERNDHAAARLVAPDLPFLRSLPPLFQVPEHHLRVAFHRVPEWTLLVAEYGNPVVPRCKRFQIRRY